MKILMMADVPPNANSGAAGTEWQTARALVRAGVQVDTVWAAELDHRISHGNLHYLLELPFSYRKVLRQRFRTTHYDVAHVNQPHGYLAAIALRGLAPRSVFVHRSHGFEGRVTEELAAWSSLRPPERPTLRRLLTPALQKALSMNQTMIARHAHGHIVSASQCAAYLAQRLHVEPQRIAVIPQAAPDEFHAPLPPADPALRYRLLYVGQHAFIKAPIFVAHTAQRVLRACPDAHFTWVCEQAHHATALALFTDKSVLPRVSMKPWVAQKDLRTLYDEHGLFIFPSLFEGFGKAFMEAMTRGLCVVAADNGGMRDVVRHGQTGYLVSTGDCAAMAQHCIDLMASPPERFLAMRSAARAAAETYTWDRVAADTLGFYEHLLRTAGTGQHSPTADAVAASTR